MRRTVLLTVNGTGIPDPFGWGFDSDLGRFVANPFYKISSQFWGPFANIFDWQPVAYPAATFPMGPSVQQGVTETMNQIARYPGHNIILSGYSQGALVTDYVWRDHLLVPKHPRLKDVIGIVNFGDPMRSPGICNGNLRAGFPIPGPQNGFTTGGISGPGDLTKDQTPDFLMSCNNDGDLYGSASVGDNPWTAETGVGHDETMIFNLVQKFDGKNLLAFVEEAMKILGVVVTGQFSLGTLLSVTTSAIFGAIGTGGIPGIPSTGVATPDHVVALVQALLNGGMFVLKGFGPHGDYAKMVPAMCDWVVETGYAHT